MVTFRDMCDTIERAEFLRTSDGRRPTSEEIFNYSPSGELSRIPMWYYCALDLLGEPNPLRVDELPEDPNPGDYRIHEGKLKIWDGREWWWHE